MGHKLPSRPSKRGMFEKYMLCLLAVVVTVAAASLASLLAGAAVVVWRGVLQ